MHRPCAPGALAQRSVEELRACGLSGQKVVYLQGLVGRCRLTPG